MPKKLTRRFIESVAWRLQFSCPEWGAVLLLPLRGNMAQRSCNGAALLQSEENCNFHDTLSIILSIGSPVAESCLVYSALVDTLQESDRPVAKNQGREPKHRFCSPLSRPVVLAILR